MNRFLVPTLSVVVLSLCPASLETAAPVRHGRRSTLTWAGLAEVTRTGFAFVHHAWGSLVVCHDPLPPASAANHGTSGTRRPPAPPGQKRGNKASNRSGKGNAGSSTSGRAIWPVLRQTSPQPISFVGVTPSGDILATRWGARLASYEHQLAPRGWGRCDASPRPKAAVGCGGQGGMPAQRGLLHPCCNGPMETEAVPPEGSSSSFRLTNVQHTLPALSSRFPHFRAWRRSAAFFVHTCAGSVLHCSVPTPAASMACRRKYVGQRVRQPPLWPKQSRAIALTAAVGDGGGTGFVVGGRGWASGRRLSLAKGMDPPMGAWMLLDK